MCARRVGGSRGGGGDHRRAPPECGRAAFFNSFDCAAFAIFGGFVPLREDELSFAIGEFKMLLRANYVKFVCINDEPQGFLFWMPNLAELTASFNGRLFPLHWIQLLYNAAFERFTSARVPLIGIRKSHQSRWRSITLVTILFESLLKDLQLYELEWMELSWIVDTNRVLVDFLRSTLGEPTRVYSVFGADIA
jgi:hypothetical protein